LIFKDRQATTSGRKKTGARRQGRGGGVACGIVRRGRGRSDGAGVWRYGT
jgi:hypothetical protein